MTTSPVASVPAPPAAPTVAAEPATAADPAPPVANRAAHAPPDDRSAAAKPSRTVLPA
ncbi:hypothetical protein [Micromonospora sp. KC723]|uniref:hypothetical protein n=1 Tax=Micromonospora sp. KC723 TaxID=2530381 RepID=UPI0014043731|nr:hypothetical protein [Micromonospora sp. KC723]